MIRWMWLLMLLWWLRLFFLLVHLVILFLGFSRGRWSLLRSIVILRIWLVFRGCFLRMDWWVRFVLIVSNIEGLCMLSGNIFWLLFLIAWRESAWMCLWMRCRMRGLMGWELMCRMCRSRIFFLSGFFFWGCWMWVWILGLSVWLKSSCIFPVGVLRILILLIGLWENL